MAFLSRWAPLVSKHWVRPLLDRRPRRPYDAKAYFERFYRRGLAAGLADRITLDAEAAALVARYHYAGLEMSILEHFARRGVPERPRVLDVGAGTGHWIDFYLEVFDAREVTAVDLVPAILEAIAPRYRERQQVRLLAADVADPELDLDGGYDVINAIGVMFHIVEDARWRQALANLIARLAPAGTLVVGGELGWLTQDVQVVDPASGGSARPLSPGRGGEPALVHKRIRSRRMWRRAAHDAGGRLERVIRSRRLPRHIEAREINIGIIRRR